MTKSISKPIKTIKGKNTIPRNVKIITDIKTVDDFEESYNIIRGMKE